VSFDRSESRSGARASEGEREPAFDRRGRPLAWIAALARQNLVVVLSWIGALAYLVARSAQTSFYSKFGVEPDEVGLGYAATLSRAANLLLVLSLVAGIVLTVAAVVRPARAPRGRRLRAPTVGVALVALVLFAVWMRVAYTSDAHRVKRGRSLRPPGLSTPGRVVTNPLGLRVEPVRVTWLGGSAGGYEFGHADVMYLGRADGIAVLFDPARRRTVRVPAGDVVLTRDG
jgi:hypothetical protein